MFSGVFPSCQLFIENEFIWFPVAFKVQKQEPTSLTVFSVQDQIPSPYLFSK